MKGIDVRGKASAALKHFGLSVLVAALVAALVFGVWYPAPYGALAGGFALFMLVVSVDVVTGPLLTFVAFNEKKPRRELRRDIGIIVLLQVAALVYGMHSVIQARPIYLSYEGNRFRVVSMADVDAEQLPSALPEFRSPGYLGPRLVGARLADGSDPDFQTSILASMEGAHPSFRPERWVPYESQRETLLKEVQPVSRLIAHYPDSEALIRKTLEKHQLTVDGAAYLPLDAEKADPVNWTVIVDRNSGLPKAFLPLDGWI